MLLTLQKKAARLSFALEPLGISYQAVLAFVSRLRTTASESPIRTSKGYLRPFLRRRRQLELVSAYGSRKTSWRKKADIYSFAVAIPIGQEQSLASTCLRANSKSENCRPPADWRFTHYATRNSKTKSPFPLRS